ncbi:hypothetical protein G9F71_023475 [Clostridium sp. FP2]|uniref:hypothetical protein n=1 Tax=Clostridium TaxID=1485 RepID=UPI001C0B1651|nr:MULTISPECIES: hypothetical protein [Clostridium]MBU3129163.1 hypothetical protein [Clostridium tagluense]MBW9156241.1 hypothetical protein [Clostridium tagluense]MBZ9625769.1 hypothetical protein [Clostridium sp. FP2]WLC65522.1 hypothetical protein KTC93_22480 [Clostridium tagluense]
MTVTISTVLYIATITNVIIIYVLLIFFLNIYTNKSTAKFNDTDIDIRSNKLIILFK